MTGEHLDADARRRVNEIFDRAIALQSADRVAFVERAAPDAAVRAEVLSLLGWHDHTDQLLPDPLQMTVPRERPRSTASRLLGSSVGHYRIDRILGEGGMGVVYQAEDQRLGRVVALKAISSAVAADPARRERLRREARALAVLAHPGIATVFALEEIGDDLFIAGEFVAGETLRDEVARGPLDAPRVLATAIELADALAAAHDRGVVHRDLKPENVMRTPTGRVKILDFGLATVRDLPPELAGLTGNGTLLGTPAYMSPEQIRRDTVDGRSDLFTLGIILFELATGTHPFGTGDAPAMLARILQDEPDSPGRSTETVHRGLHAIIRTLLQKAPAARFSSAHQLLAALERVRAGEVIAEPGPNPAAAPALRWWKFHQAATSIFYALLLGPAWWARHTLDAGDVGLPLFLAAIVAVVAATTLRMHLWFAATSMPDEWAHQYAHSRVWLRASDLLLFVAVEALGIAVLHKSATTAIVLVIAGVLAILSATIIEPATTRAAFGQAPRRSPAG